MEILNILLAITFAIILKPLLEFIYRRWKFVSTIDKIPGPVSYPIIGTSWQFFGRKREGNKSQLSRLLSQFFTTHVCFILISEMLDLSIERVTKYPGICRTWTSYIAEVRLSKPEYAEKVLSPAKNLTKAWTYNMEFKKWLGNGLVTSTGEYWHTHRKIITPTFHFSILEGFVDVFVEKCQILMEKLSKYADNNEIVDVFPLISYAALDIICGL